MDYQIPFQDILDAHERELSAAISRAILAETAKSVLEKESDRLEAELAQRDETIRALKEQGTT